VLLALGRYFPPLISAGVLAMSFGLRHAVDADHIAAIDNVTRRLISEGRQPLLVGLWFSLGHSSVVCLICVAAACGSVYLQGFFDGIFKDWGAVISTAVSAGLLLAVGIANLVSTIQVVVASQKGHAHDHGGLVARCCPMLLRAIDTEWKMVLLGFLFGLGFETSSEIALLALAAMGPSQGIPPAATLVLPLLFAGGMSLVDTIDGMLMSFAYGAAAANPGERQLYNLVLTIASSFIAIFVGVVELLGCAQTRWELDGPFWDAIAFLNSHFEFCGYIVIAFFGLSMLAALAVFTCPHSDRSLPPSLYAKSKPRELEAQALKLDAP
jgi:high-affinity nickel-transport protein